MTEKTPIISQGEEQREIIPEIAETLDPLKRIIEQIKSRIERGEYSLIIGDDSSGRIPTLILSGFIKKIYRDYGFQLPEILFLAPSGTGNDSEFIDQQKEEMKRYISSKNIQKDKKVLVVTEAIMTGQGMKALTGALQENGLSYDIATLSLFGPEENAKKVLGTQNLFWGSRLISGLYNESNLSGVNKTRSNPKSIFSKPLRKNHKVLNQAREDSSAIMEKLFDWYKQDQHEK